MHRIVFLDRATIAAEIKLRPFSFPHTLVEYPLTRPEQVVERLAGATIAIVNKVPLAAATLAQLPDLRLIAVAATGTDMVDKDYCRSHGIAVCNVPGYATASVTEHTFALILALRRRLVAYREALLAGEWQRRGQFCFFLAPTYDLAGARLGIIGRGVLGRRVAEIGRAFGMEPVFAGRKGKPKSAVAPPYTPWEEVLETSDVLSLHCPLTAETRGLIALPEFRRMQRKPLLINTARGGLVVEADLETALNEGLVSGAGFDVTTPEPPPADSVLMRLVRRDDVIVTPHLAWASMEAQGTLAERLVDNIEAFVAGRPVNLVSGAY